MHRRTLLLLCAGIAILGSAALAAPYPGRIGYECPGDVWVDTVQGNYRWQVPDGSGGWMDPTGAEVDSSGWPTTDCTYIQDWRPVAEWAGEIDDPEVYRVDRSGTYSCSFTGQATLTHVEGAFSISNQYYNSGTNTTTFDLTIDPPGPHHGIVVFRFTNTKRTSSSPTGSGITNFRMVRPGYAGDTTQTFTDAALACAGSADFSFVRYMGVLNTNNNVEWDAEGPIYQYWSNRKLTTDAGQGTISPLNKKDGWAWEYIIQWANQTGHDMWINIPVAVDDNYVYQLASLVHSNLDPGLNIYLEHSNEMWNWGFIQYAWNKAAAEEEVNAGGSNLNYDGSTDVEMWAQRRHARRVKEIVDIFASVFGSGEVNGRLRGMLCGIQGDFFTVGKWAQMLTFLDDNYGAPSNYIYAIGGTGYFGGSAASGAAGTENYTVDQILDDMRAVSDDEVAWRQTGVSLANQWGLPGGYCFYEAGPDNGGGSTTNVANRITANRVQRMYTELLHNYDDNFLALGGNLINQFTLEGSYQRYGCWGMTDDISIPDRNYKYDAIVALIGSGGGPVTSPAAPSGLSASAVSSSQINLAWTDNADNESGFKIERKTGGGSFSQIGTVNANVTTYPNGGLSPSTTYTYRVRAYNGAGDSSYSNEASATTQAGGGGDGTGLTGEYYDNIDLTNLTLTRTDATVDFDWGSGSPDPSIGADTFSVRWSGQVQPLYSETYTFYTNSDDGIRLWVNAQQVIDNWTDHGPTEDSGTIGLTAGTKYDILMEFYENGGGAVAQLSWSSASQAKQIIPQLQLYPSGGTGGVPDAPSNLTASAGDGYIDLSWNGSTGADQYNIYRGTGGNYYLQDSTAATSWRDNNVTNGTTYYYYVTAENSYGESAASNGVIATPQGGGGGLPAPWQNADVGSPGQAGTASEAGGTFTIEGGGADIWGTYDSFHYVYQSLSGDGEITARVTSVENTDAWAKAGVMIRESLTGGSRHAMTVVTAGNNVAFQRRTATDGSSSHTAASGSAPYWVRLVRSGDTFTASSSSDGSGWTEIGSETISMAGSVYIGLCVTAHNDGTLCTAEFTNVDVQTGGGDTTPPAAPTGLSATAGDGQVSLDWNNNSEGDLAGYRVYRSTTSGSGYGQIASPSSSAYTDSGVSNGTTYYYVVTAYDTSDNESGYSNEASATPQGGGGGGSGTILREWWTGIGGNAISDLTSSADYPDNPAGSNEPTSFEAPTDWADNYGTRMRGYVHPPSTGSYTFWISSDDNGELWLSTDESPANAGLIANVPGWSSSREWTKYTEQQSASISLTGGQKYYVEALQKEGGGGDNLAVAWQGPGIGQAVIDGQYLSPWEGGGGGPDAFLQDSGAEGIVCFEAENYDANTPQGSHTWTQVTSPSGYSGSAAMESQPNSGTNNNTGYAANSPRLDFQVNFVKTGTHYVWVRGYGPDGSGDSCHAGIDGAESTTSDRINSFTTSYAWHKDTMDGVDATVNVSSTGVHTVNVWMREDGFICDKVLLTTSSSYTPTGTGPAESPRGGGGGGSADITVTCDNGYDLYVNGALVGSDGTWEQAQTYQDVALQSGTNVIALACTDTGGVAGLLGEFTVDGQRTGTSTSWKVSLSAPGGWNTAGFDDSGWAAATDYGAPGVSPWGTVSGMPLDTPGRWIWSSDNDLDDAVYVRYTFSMP
jgi:regulation of enolase protein 1 (concanavalin A-like superfamily)